MEGLEFSGENNQKDQTIWDVAGVLDDIDFFKFHISIYGKKYLLLKV